MAGLYNIEAEYDDLAARNPYTEADTPTSGGAGWRAQLNLFVREETFISESLNYGQMINNRAKIIGQLGGDEELAGIYGSSMPEYHMQRLRKLEHNGLLEDSPEWHSTPEHVKKSFQHVREMENRHPDQVLSDEALNEQRNADFASWRSIEEDIIRRAPWYASFLGAMHGAMTDPVVIGSMPFGGTLAKAGTTAFKTGLRFAAIESAVAIGTEIPIQAAVYKYKRKLDAPWGFADSAMNVLAAGAGGAFLGGLMGAGGQAGRNFMDARKLTKATQEIRRQMDSAAIVLSREEIEALEVLERTAFINRMNPLVDTGAARVEAGNVGEGPTFTGETVIHLKDVDTGEPIPVSTVQHDPQLVTIEKASDELGESINVTAKSGYFRSINEIASEQEGVLYRGVSSKEYEEIISSGTIKSSGKHMQSSQQGKTSYAHAPAIAEGYAIPKTVDDVAYIIAIEDPKTGAPATRQLKGTEIDIPGKVSANKIINVYEKIPATITDTGQMSFVYRLKGVDTASDSTGFNFANPTEAYHYALEVAQRQDEAGLPVDVEDVVKDFQEEMVTIWHGGPYEYDSFDISKIGTGEGAQAYGWGLYFTETREIATGYKNAVTMQHNLDAPTDLHKYMSGGVELKDTEYNTEVMDDIIAQGYGATKIDYTEVVQRLESKGVKPGAHGEGFLLKHNKSKLEDLEKIGNINITKEPMSHLYEVNIPKSTIDNMLDWDKPLSEQPGSVRNALKKADSDMYRDFIKNEKSDTKYKVNYTGGTFYENLSRKLMPEASFDSKAGLIVGGKDVGQEMVSKRLLEAGIPGIKYLDGTSRSAGEGTRNFVIFDDQLPVIVKRNDQPIKAPKPEPVGKGEYLEYYHGTQHKWSNNKYDFDRAGTGEGAAGEGFGGYLTDSPEFASIFRNTMSSTDPTGNVYKVRILKSHVDNMLEWDKPLSKQPESVQRFFKENMDNNIKNNDPSGKELYESLGRQLGSYYDGSDAQRLASKTLLDSGIPGVRYINRHAGANPGMENIAAGKQINDVVFFDPNIVEVVEINNIPIKAPKPEPVGKGEAPAKPEAKPAVVIENPPRSIVKKMAVEPADPNASSRTGIVSDDDYMAVLEEWKRLSEDGDAKLEVTTEVDGQMVIRNVNDVVEELETLDNTLNDLRLCSLGGGE